MEASPKYSLQVHNNVCIFIINKVFIVKLLRKHELKKKRDGQENYRELPMNIIIQILYYFGK